MRSPTTAKPPINKADREISPLFDPMYFATRTLVGFTQGLFNQLPPGQYHWSSDPDETEIVITDAMPITIESLSMRPAIITMQGQAGFLNSTMRSLEGINVGTGHHVFRDIIQGSATFNCVSRNGVEASRLAWFVASQIKALRVFLQRHGPFVRIGHDVNILGEQPAGLLVNDPSDGGAYNVPVSVPFFLPYKWEVREPAFMHDVSSVQLTHANKTQEGDTDVSFKITSEVNNG